MPEISFAVESVEPVRHAIVPMLGFGVRLSDHRAQRSPIHSIMLRTQVRIQAARRKYNPAEQERLLGLFDKPERWGQTVRELSWAHITTLVPPFSDQTSVQIQVPCSFDFALAATQYFDALEAGEAPLCFLFSGTVFYESTESVLQVMQIPWDKEARFRMPVTQWHSLMREFYGNTAWLGVRKDLFDRLRQFRIRHGISNWEDTLEELLGCREAGTA